MILGKYIKQKRIEMGVTQMLLAQKVGLHTQQVSNCERGVCAFPRKKLKRLCRTLLIDREIVYDILMREAQAQICNDLGLKLS